jgi:amino acid transporter
MAEKGLKSNVVGLFGGTLLGISSVAPAYVLTITLGVLAVSVGEKIPVVLIAGFLPMFFAAYAYREFNRIMPDAGTALPGPRRHSAPTSAGWVGGPLFSPRSSCCPISPELRFSSCISSSAAR